jgi:hypothetical protein
MRLLKEYPVSSMSFPPSLAGSVKRLQPIWVKGRLLGNKSDYSKTTALLHFVLCNCRQDAPEISFTVEMKRLNIFTSPVTSWESTANTLAGGWRKMGVAVKSLEDGSPAPVPPKVKQRQKGMRDMVKLVCCEGGERVGNGERFRKKVRKKVRRRKRKKKGKKERKKKK